LFPSGQFGGQELANNADIKKFAREKGFNGTVMAKGDVEGANATPMWSYCLDKFPGGVGWNFKAKFIVDREGNVVNRNSSSAQDQEALIKPLLKKKKNKNNNSDNNNEKRKRERERTRWKKYAAAKRSVIIIIIICPRNNNNIAIKAFVLYREREVYSALIRIALQPKQTRRSANSTSL